MTVGATVARTLLGRSTVAILLIGSSIGLSRASAAEVDPGREASVRLLLDRWASPGRSRSQLETAVHRANAAQLERLGAAETFADVQHLLGARTSANRLGDTTQDLVYTPVPPCRLFDTRLAGGVLTAATSREFFAYGTTEISGQGGNPAGCASPRGEPRAVHINLAVIPQGALGNARVYPADVTTPTAAFVTFNATDVTSNAGTVQTQYAPGTPEIEVYVSASAHLVGDVMGYYYSVDDMSQYFASFGGLNSGGVDATTSYQKIFDFVTFTKASDASTVEVTMNTRAFSGTFGGGAVGVIYQLRIDDVPTVFGNEAAITTSNTIAFVSAFAVFEGLAAGSHTVSVWAQAASGTSTGVFLDPGGFGGKIIVKETY
jgi:hypothetical protein